MQKITVQQTAQEIQEVLMVRTRGVKIPNTATESARTKITSAQWNAKNNCMSKLSPSIQRCAYSAMLSSVANVRLEPQEAEGIERKRWSI